MLPPFVFAGLLFAAPQVGSAMMRGFGTFAGIEPGLHEEIVEVTTSDGVELTEVVVLPTREVIVR